MGKNSINPLKPLSLGKLWKDLQLIMGEIDRTNGVLPDYYSPVMWQRLQNTAEKVADAIQCVRMKLSSPNMTSGEIAAKLGMEKVQQVAGYLAWNSMLAPDWVKPQHAVEYAECPKCGAKPGQPCVSSYILDGILHTNPVKKVHPTRREAFKKSTIGQQIMQERADLLVEKYGVSKVGA